MSQTNKNVEPDLSPSHIVGIGASAGGLEAIEQFIKNMTDPSGLAFVIVQHLSPEYKSLMVELLSKYTAMPVLRIEDGMMTEKDSVYLIPPRKNLKLFHGRLLLIDQERSEGQINLPIDIFFRSLAEDQGEKAIGIVLSGTGSDGTRGIRAIKENGGMAMAQSEESAKFDSMPKNAIDTGLIDFVLPPDAMPRQLLSFVKHPYAKIFSEKTVNTEGNNGLARIFSLLRESHKVDFTHYKPSTVIRRIERRITINQCRGLNDYIALLETRQAETSALFQELLIGVTGFFRDQSVFDALRDKIIPDLFTLAENNELRIWVAGCSTGEEAYSIAMLCAEHKDLVKSPIRIKIFATDVDSLAIEKAGTGVFPGSVSADISPDFLSRFFVRVDENYRVAREIREMVVFAQHNLIKDPPFTNINMVTCRNLLIYLQPILQKKVLELFNFSLNPKGILLLGNSESIGDMEDSFTPLDNKNKFFQSRGKQRLLGFSATPPNKNWSPSTLRFHQENESLLRLSEERFFNRFIQLLSEQAILPLTIIVNEKMEVTHIFGDSGEFLRFTSGKINLDIAKVVIKELSIPVSTGLNKALKSRQAVSLTNIRIFSMGNSKIVNVRIFPMQGRGVQENTLAVLINEVLEKKPDISIDSGITYNVGLETEQRISDLEQELQFSRENLQATVEELETSNEELQATNEELLASNEELQSTNEELQSVNEELYTVNAEFQSKITELTILNTDMDNLFNSTQIAALFLDENLEIRRFTPRFKELFPIMEGDIGRPINHLSMQLGERIHLKEIINKVVATGNIVECEFEAGSQGWNLLRATPYQISDSINAGVVLTVINIDQLKQTQQELLNKTRKKIHLLAKVVKDSRDAIIQFTGTGAILSWNRGAERMYGWNEEEAETLTMPKLFPNNSGSAFDIMIRHVVSQDRDKPLSLPRLTKSGEILLVTCDFTVLTGPGENSDELIIASREHDDNHYANQLRYECVRCTSNIVDTMEHSREAVVLLTPENKIIAWNTASEKLLGWSHDQAATLSIEDLLPDLAASDAGSVARFNRVRNHNGAVIEAAVTVLPLGPEHGAPYNLLMIQAQ
ncbi:MAG: chemotaxis protein CheB [Gammaproteobacteria bacterium]